MSDEPRSALAMCWYVESQWKILKELAPDTLDADYETWRKNASRVLQQMTAVDHKVQKVAIKIDAFLRWCDERGVDPNTDLRSAYAVWVLQRRV
jgi:hypothetical protein